MKNVIYGKLFLAAAALTLGISTAYAQFDAKMKAEIPFSFSVGNQEYSAGNYEVAVVANSGGVRILRIANVQTGTKQLAVPALTLYPYTPSERDGSARLVFRCGDGRSACSLMQVWPGNASAGMLMRAPAVKGNERQHLAVIGLRPWNAD